MTMNCGASRSSSQGMLDAAKTAAEATKDQLSIAYQRAGINLTREQTWKKIGLTLMIDRNDLPGETFELNQASALEGYVAERQIQRLSMWSLNLDAPCPSDEQHEAASSTAAAWTRVPRNSRTA
jgi:chitinase